MCDSKVNTEVYSLEMNTGACRFDHSAVQENSAHRKNRASTVLLRHLMSSTCKHAHTDTHTHTQTHTHGNGQLVRPKAKNHKSRNGVQTCRSLNNNYSRSYAEDVTSVTSGASQGPHSFNLVFVCLCHAWRYPVSVPYHTVPSNTAGHIQLAALFK